MRRRLSFLALAGPVLAAPLVLHAPADAAVVRCHGLVATIVGDGRNETIIGTPGRDVIHGLGGHDTIDARGGNDVVCGGRGSDKLFGGSGDDRLYGGLDGLFPSEEDDSVERIGDLLRGGPGDDRLVGGRDTRRADETSRDAFSWVTATRGVRIDLARGVATGQGRDTFDPSAGPIAVEGSRHDDVVLGSRRADRISTLQGSDVVRAGDGADVVHADPVAVGARGDDFVAGGEGDDTLESWGGDDHLVGGPGRDFLADLGRGVDLLQGGLGADHLLDQLPTAPGERLAGGPGRDRLDLFGSQVNPGADPATASMSLASGQVEWDAGEPGALTATGFEWLDLATYGFVWTVTGTSGADRVGASGSAGTTFDALGGDDLFMGSASDDTFRGGSGTDRNLGMGIGTNTCISVEVDDDGSCSP